MYTYAHQQLLNIDITHDLEEFRAAAPFHRLHPSQRSASETALNDRKYKKTSSLAGGDHSGSTSALADRGRDTAFGSRYSLPVDSNPYRRSSLEQGDGRKSQPTRSALHNSSPNYEHSSKHQTTGASDKNKSTKTDGVESFSSDSSYSDD